MRAGRATATGAPTNPDADGARRAAHTRGVACRVGARGAPGANGTKPNILKGVGGGVQQVPWMGGAEITTERYGQRAEVQRRMKTDYISNHLDLKDVRLRCELDAMERDFDGCSFLVYNSIHTDFFKYATNAVPVNANGRSESQFSHPRHAS